MNEQLKNAIKEGRAILFLGSGASIGSRNNNNESPPLAGQLAKLIAEKAGWTYSNEALSIVYSAARGELGNSLDDLLIENYKNCKPSKEYSYIARFPWARIYTTNIDDALEKALSDYSNQKLNVKNRNDRIEDKDQLFQRLEYIYLNGSIKFPDSGYVFSPEEYGKASASQPQWYEEVAADYLQCTFIFIGSSLDESVFYHQVERYKERTSGRSPSSYVISPNATAIQIASLRAYGLTHINGTLEAFCDWLKGEFTEPPLPIEIAKARFPELRMALENHSIEKQSESAELLRHINLVSRQSLVGPERKSDDGTIRAFYRGFKPTWRDILDEVPAELSQFNLFVEQIKSAGEQGNQLIALVGPAGSGKSTMLKMAALKISAEEKVYFLSSIPEDLQKVLLELEKANNTRFYVFIDRIDPIKTALADLIDRLSNSIIVSAESQNVWHNRISLKFGNSKIHKVDVRDIAEVDVSPILQKIQIFGPWTRLAGMSDSQRKREVFEKSKRQLLIGLMEVTTGLGFEQIIQRDYESISTEEDKLFFVLVCIATMHRCDLSSSMAARSLSFLGVKEAPISIASRLRGIVDARDASFVARHSLYARKILENIVDRKLVAASINALLYSFTVYKHPIVKNINKNDANLFKATINHRFLADVLREDQQKILEIYAGYEKYFESDGLFWLQYGLSERSFGNHPRAFELLQTAHSAYPHDHTTHALAQQKMILASSGLLTAEQARSHLAEAITLLEKLDDTLESDDTYPIVTLAEGHVRSTRALDGDSAARVTAKGYVERIGQRLRKERDPRLQESQAKLLKYASTGFWSDMAER